MYKKIMPRTLSAVLTAAMLSAYVTVPAEAELIPIPLEASRIGAERLPEGNLIYMGTASASVNEENAVYEFPIYREGDISEEASVKIHSLDLTAVYGEDYILLEEETEKTGDGVSILERYATAGVSDEEEAEYVIESLEETAENEDTGETIYADTEEYEDIPDEEKSLRRLKEEQTGLKSRDPYDSPDAPSAEDYQRAADEMVPAAMASVEYSSETTITFAEGEAEKIVRFKILDDNKSEGNEGFTLLLVNPENAELYEVTSLSVNIEDDEPKERSEISFSKAGYKSKDGKAVVTIKRKGAQYSLCDFTLLSSEDTAIAGENYEEVNETVAFMPYETEKEIEIPVTGEGEFKLLMRDLSGCEEGKYTETIVKINEGDIADIRLMGGEAVDFNAKISNSSYTVKYSMPSDNSKGAQSGTIYADGFNNYSYDTPPEAGIYYFSTDVNKGGLFRYGNYSGDKPWGCGYRHSDYQMDEKIRSMDGGSHYGRLEYYHTSIWDNGTAYTYSDNVPTVYFQYMTPDWESTSSFGGGQKASFAVGSNKSYKTGKFDRSYDEGSVKLMDSSNKPLTADSQLEVRAIDDDGGKTPKSLVRFYGVAAMYKKLNVQVMPLNDLTYKTSGGSFSAAPLQVTLDSGAERIGTASRDFWTNIDPNKSNIVLSINDTTINGRSGKFGYVSGYTIALNPGTASDKVTLNYPDDFISYMNSQKGKSPSSELNFSSTNIDNEIKKIRNNMAAIPFDVYFISWIESKQKKVIDDGHGYYQKVEITPKVSYSNINVEVTSSIGDGTGHFTDLALSSTGTYTYHAGDTINLSAAADSDNCHVVGYAYSTDGGIKYNTITDTTDLFLEPNTSYKIRPVIAKNTNKIELQLTNSAKNALDIQGLITEADLAACSDEDLVKELRGKYVLNANPEEKDLVKKITPVDGKVYTISFTNKTDGSTVARPVIKQGNNTYTTNAYYTTGKALTADNIISVDVETVSKSSLEVFDINGTLVSAAPPVRNTGLAVKKLPLSGYTVAAGKGTQSRNNNSTQSYITDGASSASMEDGAYALMGISGREGDVIPIYISNGLSNGSVASVKLTKSYGKENGAYQVKAGNTEITYPYGAPKVTAIMYSYDKTTNNAAADMTHNQIRIVDDNLTVTAIVDKCGRDIKEAVFTVTTSTGTKTEYKGYPTSEGSNVIECKIDAMAESLFSGDTMSVKLIDREKKTLQNGGDIDIVYPEVDTGLSFYTENALTTQQVFDFENTPTIDIPLIGSALGQGKSGILNFGKTKWPNDTGYTIQINADATFMGKGSLTNKEKKAAYDKFHAGARQAADDKTNAMYLLRSEYEGGAPHIGDYDSIEEYHKAFDEYVKTLKQAKDPMAGFNSKIMSVEAAFVLAFDFVKMPDGSYMFACGTVAVGGMFAFNKTMYSLVSNVPVFLNIQASLQANAVVSYVTEDGANALSAGEFDSYEGNIADRLESTEVKFSVVISGKVQVGVGMCGVLSARGYASLTFQFDIYCVQPDGGALLTIVGGVGFDLLILSIDIDIVKYTQGWGTLAGKSETSFFNGLLSVNERDDSAFTSRKYSNGSADMSSFGKTGGIKLMATEKAVSYEILQDNAADRTRPHIIPLDDGRKMITFIGNGTSLETSERDEDNAATLFYSVYDSSGWSTPVPVADDGTIDSTPAMKKVGDKVLIAWADANGTVTENETTKNKLNKLGISCAVYDIASGKMGDEITIADNRFFNLSPQINVDGDMLYISYMTRDLSELGDGDSELIDFNHPFSTMSYVSYNMASGEKSEVQYINIPHEALTDPLVMDYNAVTTSIGGESYMLSVYTVDGDENLNTGEDRELYLGIHNLTTDNTYFPIRITDDDKADSVPKLTDIDGNVYLTWLNDGYMFNITDVTEILEGLFNPDSETKNEEGNTIALFNEETVKTAYKNGFMASPGDKSGMDWYKKDASGLGMTDEAYESSIYSDLANGDFRVQSANFQGNDELRTSVGSYIVTSNGDDIYIYYTEFSKDREKNGTEIYGVRYKRGESSENDDDTNTEWGFGKAVQITDFGMVLDELDLYMTEDNRISAVSNFFEQWTDDNDAEHPIKYSENKLAEVDFEPVSSLDIQYNDIVFPSKIYPSVSEEITLNIENSGLLDGQGYTLKVSDNKGNTIYNETSDTVIEAGGSIPVTIPWTVPADVMGMEITVEVTEAGVSNPEIASVTKAVPYDTRLQITDVDIEERDDGYYVTAQIKNNGSKPSGTAEITLASNSGKTENDKTYGSLSAGAIAGGETMEIEIPFEPGFDDFNHLGYIDLRLEASDGDNTADAYTRFITSQPIMAEINGGGENISLKGKDDTAKLEAAAAPWNSYAGDVRFYSSDNGVAVVDEDGNVTPKGNGTATLYAYYPLYGVGDTIDVTVSGIISDEPEPTAKPRRSGGGGTLRTKAIPTPSVIPNASVSPEETAAPDTTAKPADSGLWFADVPQNAWYYEPVKYAYAGGLMSGVSDTEFAPESDITRGMFVTVLHRMDKEPQPKAKTAFSDVVDGVYYANAVAWANENGIIAGYSDTEFAPEDKITREQLAAIMHRYAKYKAYDVSVGEDTNILSYTDALDISEYAVSAMQWVCGEGIVSGFEDNTLRPKANTTRAQAAAILERFIEGNNGSSETEQSFEIAPLEGEPSDYSDENNWINIPEITKDVDTIYFYPTAYNETGDDVAPICDIDNENMRTGAVDIYNKQATAFAESTNVFAPYYRQTNINALSGKSAEEFDKIQRGVQRTDMYASLDYYFENYNDGRPFIIAGHSQGAQMIKIALGEYFKAHPEYLERMVAAYPIGYSFTNEWLNENGYKFAEGADDTGVIVSWNTEGPENKDHESSVVLPGALAINPINWKRDDTYAAKEENLGSLVINDKGEQEIVPGLNDAQIDLERGVVICTTSDAFVPMPEIFGPASLHGQDYGLYYANIQENAKTRVDAYLNK